jgi:hypothetical protein
MPLINAFGNVGGGVQPGVGAGDFSALGAGVSDIFSGFADETKARGDLLEAQNYDAAAQPAFQNEQYTKMSTAIQEAQSNREFLLAQGRTTADVAGAGFAGSGRASAYLGQAGQSALRRGRNGPLRSVIRRKF